MSEAQPQGAPRNIEADALTLFHDGVVERLEGYFARTNELVGTASFGAALACVGLDLPVFYALLSVGFVALTWADVVAKYRGYLRAVRLAKRKPLTFAQIIWRLRVAVFGWVVLGGVAFGLLDKKGVVIG